MNKKIEKIIKDLDLNISIYLTKNKLNVDNLKETGGELVESKLKKDKFILFELLGWRNFMQFASGLTEEERISKFDEYKDILIYNY